MKVQLPFIGKATGSSAGLIFQSYWGGTYSRSFPSIFHYPDTPKQQAAQAPFHEINKAWALPYGIIKNAVGENQRRNRNIYNEYLKQALKIYNPYDIPKQRTPLQNFGPDPFNRMRASMLVTYKYIDDSYILIRWQDWAVEKEISYTPSHRIFLLMNKTSRTLHSPYGLIIPSVTGLNIQNYQDWKATDDIVFYVAVYGEGWLGNFNLIPLP